MKSDIYKTNLDTADELLARILDAAASVNKREDYLRRTTSDFRTRFAKGVELGGESCEHLL